MAAGSCKHTQQRMLNNVVAMETVSGAPGDGCCGRGQMCLFHYFSIWKYLQIRSRTGAHAGEGSGLESDLEVGIWV